MLNSKQTCSRNGLSRACTPAAATALGFASWSLEWRITSKASHSESAFGRQDALGLLDYRTAAQGLGKLAGESLLLPGPLGNVDKAARRQVCEHLAGQQIIIGPVSLGEALEQEGV
jgi:hypothetical protein